MAHSPEVQKEAFDLWLNGMATYKIAKQLNIGVATVKHWAKKNNWAVQKSLKIKEAENQVVLRFEKKIVSGAEAYFDISLMVASICRKKLQKVINEDFAEISNIVKDALRGAQIYRAIMPDAPEVLVKQLLQELKRESELRNGQNISVSNTN